MERRILRLASKGVLDVGAFIGEWKCGSQSVLRAIGKLVREGLVVTYYRVPSGKEEWN